MTIRTVRGPAKSRTGKHPPRATPRLPRPGDPPSDAGPSITLSTACIVGGLCGLTWSAALRGWMVQIAGPGQSQVTWLTFPLLLLPGIAVGIAFGRAALLRAHRAHSGRLTIFAPALLASALLDPKIFHSLITNGEGGGSLMVVITMLAGGHALGSRQRPVLRVATGALAVLGVGALFAMGSMAAPLSSPHGLWVALYGASLMAVAAIASALPYEAPGALRSGTIEEETLHHREATSTAAENISTN